MRAVLLSVFLLILFSNSFGQSSEILTILKDQLQPAIQIENNLKNIKPYVERRETNENEYALQIMKDAGKLETAANKGIYNTKRLREKLNEQNKNNWSEELSNLISYFSTIKEKAVLIKDNASSLYYLFHKKETAVKYYNEMVTNSHIILENANYARQTYSSLEAIKKWELFELNKTIKINDNTIQEYKNTVKNYDKPEAGCISGNCENGYGVYVSTNGTKSEGFFIEKALDGVSKIDYNTGEVYVGEMARGYRHGVGLMQINQREFFFGCWNNNKKHGMGIYIKKDGSLEKGFFKDNEFVNNDMQSSISQIVTIDQSKEGCIKGNCENGFGIYKYNNGDIYLGKWSNSKREGFGNYYYKSGHMYCGEFKDGAFHGFGGFLINPGAQFEAYIGDWKNSKKHGRGTYVNKDGTFKKGVWDNNEFKSN